MFYFSVWWKSAIRSEISTFVANHSINEYHPKLYFFLVFQLTNDYYLLFRMLQKDYCIDFIFTYVDTEMQFNRKLLGGLDGQI